MANQQPITNFVFELEQIKSNVLTFASRVGADIKALRTGSDMINYKLTGLNVNLTGAITSSDSVLSGFGKLQNQVTKLAGTVLTASSDANNLSGSGVFNAPASTVTTTNNFPTNEGGSLTQRVIGTSKTQQYLTVTGLFYVRGFDGTTWSSWRSI